MLKAINGYNGNEERAMKIQMFSWGYWGWGNAV